MLPDRMHWARISLLLLAAAASRTVWDGVYTKEQATRGQAVYLEECARCHGMELAGNEAPALTGEEFLKDWNGKTAGDLFDVIRKTMPDDDPGVLSGRDYVDVIAFVLSANHFPAGEKELEPEISALNEIRIEPRR
jgi:quinoprotein glucose dehydrogenase